MKKELLFILCSIFLAAGFASAQTVRKTVTNADLEKFRQKRLAAENDYRENYAKMGFPSPEELEKQREQDSKNLSALSARLERENYIREQQQRADEYQQAQNQAFYNNNQGSYYGNGSSGGYYGGYVGGYYGGYPYYGYSNGYNYNYRRFGRGGYYNTIAPGTPFSSLGGVRINTNGVRINTGRGFRGGFGTGGGIRVGGGVGISVGSGGIRAH